MSYKATCEGQGSSKPAVLCDTDGFVGPPCQQLPLQQRSLSRLAKEWFAFGMPASSLLTGSSNHSTKIGLEKHLKSLLISFEVPISLNWVSCGICIVDQTLFLEIPSAFGLSGFSFYLSDEFFPASSQFSTFFPHSLNFQFCSFPNCPTECWCPLTFGLPPHACYVFIIYTPH